MRAAIGRLFESIVLLGGIGLSALACDSLKRTRPAPTLPGSSSTQPVVVDAPGATEALAPVPTVDLTVLSPADFTDEELELPYYLAHLATVANAIESKPPHRGFIKLSVWRGSDQPHNARVMENILSLSWFYSQKRSWNPYYGNHALRARLEAALDYWSRSQSSDGQFSEYEPGGFGLAPTAFATKFLSEALLLLRVGPAIDAKVLAAAEQTLVRAVRATLTLPALYTTGSSYSNQYGNVWGGGLALLSFHPDASLRTLWEQRFRQSRTDFQSPAGFYYEGDGPDFEYTLTTHDHNVRQAWEWLRSTSLAEELLERERAWFEWLALNAVAEPGGGFTLNSAVATRKPLTGFKHYDTPLAEQVPEMRAFAQSVEEVAERRKRERDALVAGWPHVKPLVIGEFSAFTPYTFLHRRRREWRPTTAERDAARAALPVTARSTFTIQRGDSRRKATFLFVRRSGYYAALTTGERASPQQRYGLGLLWLPGLGTVIASQRASDATAWGTRAPGRPVYEAGNLDAQVGMDGVNQAPAPGSRELGTGRLVVKYPLAQRGQKTLTFTNGAMQVAVRHEGEVEEVLPLLVPSDGRVEQTSDGVSLTTPRGSFAIQFGAKVVARLSARPEAVLDKRLFLVTLQARDRLDYSLLRR